jgi:hypothetical protein
MTEIYLDNKDLACLQSPSLIQNNMQKVIREGPLKDAEKLEKGNLWC